MSDDFIKQVTDKLKQDKERAALETERSVQRANTIKGHAPQQWQELRNWVKNFCENANRNMDEQTFTFRVTPNSEIIVDLKAPRGSRMLEAKFFDQTNEIGFEALNRKFMPEEDHGKFFFVENGRAVSVEQMGQTLIRSLMGN